MRALTPAERLVFGDNAQIDPVTDRPIEQGVGAVTARDLAAQRAAEQQRRDAEAKTKSDLAQTQAELAAAQEALGKAETEKAELLARAEKAEAELAAAAKSPNV